MLKQFLKFAAVSASMTLFFATNVSAQWTVNGTNDVYRLPGKISLGNSAPAATLDLNPVGVTRSDIRLLPQGDGVTPTSYAGITFNNGFSIYNSNFPACGTGYLSWGSTASGASANVRMNSYEMVFGNIGSGCGSATIPGTFKFGSQVAATKLIVSPAWGPGPSSYTDIPSGFIFGVNGNGYFRTGVGIGTSCIPAGYALAVKGKVIAEEVNVRLAASTGCWPDYVFGKDYKLRSLNEVESFINTNSHLPEVPSAQEIENNGINTAAMDAALLKKIEELTLYVIELNKKVEVLEKQNKELQGK
jgi:hypothetical protein